MMDITSNELLRRKAVSEGKKAFFYASAENTLSPGLGFGVSVGEKRKRSELGESCNTGNDNGDGERKEELVQPKISESSGVKFNDFDKLKEEVRYGQTWALYDTVDGFPRQYALIRKVSVPSFEIRITYLEHDPDNEKEIQWFEQDLPVSAGKFRLGKSQNTEDLSVFSHVMHCNGGRSSGHLIVSPRKGETWGIFKNSDINWSSEPDSHHKYEYEIVEMLSGCADGAGVSVAILHKAKGFASVFFRMGAGDADTLQIPSHSLYQFSHRIPSYKMKRVETKGVPKDAYELDQAAVPGSMEEKTVPPHRVAEPKPEALCFPSKGKVFQADQVWSFSNGYNDIPRYYDRIHNITLSQAFEQAPELELHVGRFRAKPYQEEVIQWKDKRMPVGCGTFLVNKGCTIFPPSHLLHQMVRQTSMDGNECTILPKIGDVWAIYQMWDPSFKLGDLDKKVFDFEMVEIVDDASDFKVIALESVFLCNEDGEKKVVSRAAESRPSYACSDEDGSEVIFTIKKSKMRRFSHWIPASRVTKKIDGELEEIFEVNTNALPFLFKFPVKEVREG